MATRDKLVVQVGNCQATLVEYERATPDLVVQTGDKHDEALREAKSILIRRGLEVGSAEFIGASGIYYPVREAL